MGDGPVVVADTPGEAYVFSHEVAAWLAAGLGRPVERVEVGFGDARQLLDAAGRASALVVATGAGDPVRGRMFGGLSDEVVARSTVPVYVVRATGAPVKAVARAGDVSAT